MLWVIWRLGYSDAVNGLHLQNTEYFSRTTGSLYLHPPFFGEQFELVGNYGLWLQLMFLSAIYIRIDFPLDAATRKFAKGELLSQNIMMIDEMLSHANCPVFSDAYLCFVEQFIPISSLLSALSILVAFVPATKVSDTLVRPWLGVRCWVVSSGLWFDVIYVLLIGPQLSLVRGIERYCAELQWMMWMLYDLWISVAHKISTTDRNIKICRCDKTDNKRTFGALMEQTAEVGQCMRISRIIPANILQVRG